MRALFDIRTALRRICIGIVIGIANVIPGVSGGTMAVAFNIYEPMLACMSLDFRTLRSYPGFLWQLLLGMGLGILLFSRAAEFMLLHYPMPTHFFFIGVILGSLPLITHHLRGEKLKFRIALSFLISLGIMCWITFVNADSGGSALLVQLDIAAFLKLAIASAIGAMAMVVPGISGSLLLVVLGVYPTIIGAVSDLGDAFFMLVGLYRGVSTYADLRISFIFPVILGGLIGLVAGGRVTRYLLRRYPAPTYGAILGLMIGSILAIWPGFTWDLRGLFSVPACVLGVLLTLGFAFLDQKHA